MASTGLPRLRADLAHLVHRGLGAREFSLAAARVIRRAVPYDGVCVLTMDPATLLPTSEVVENGLPPSARPRMAEIELGETDFNKFAGLARCRMPAASLSEATEGKLERSRRYRELKRPNGFGDELRAALVDDSGAWGGLTFLRETGSPNFTAAEAETVASLSRYIVEGLRRTVLLREPPGEPADSGDPGLLVLADEESIAMENEAARRWLEELGAESDRLPPVIRAAARRARAAAEGAIESDVLASARVRTPAGRWLVVRGSMLGDQVAVILEPAGPPELAPLIAHAYGLTDRERSVTQLVAQGLSTNEIAGRLYLAPYTVQDHLKSIFEKTGVGTRGELVARLFFDHYAPRLSGDALP
jgi:DNA-binding CsgD family transcriptional regulator